MVQAYSIYETKTHLSEILRLVKSGKEVIINERGHSIARILPFKAPDSLAERWEWMCQAGHIVKATETSIDFSEKISSPGALKRFLEDRNA